MTRLEGLEAVETGAGRFHAYRVAVAVTYDDGNVLPWTDWYAGDRLLVKRVINSQRQGGGALTSPEQTLRLEEFTPGR